MLGFTDNARPPLFGAMLTDLGLSDAGGAVVFAGASGGVIAGSFLFKEMVRRNAVRGMQLAMLGVALGIGLSGAAEGFWSLALASFLFGVALGGLALAQNLMVEQAVPEALKRRALTGLHSFYALASLLAPAAVAGLLELGANWRTIFCMLAAPPVGVAALLFLVRRREPPKRSEEAGGKTGARLGRQVLIAFVAGSCVVAELLLTTRLPLLMERDGATPEAAALSLSLFFFCLLASRIAFSLIPLRLSNQRLLALSAGTALLLNAVGLWVEPWVLPFVPLALGPFFPTIVALLSEEFPGELEGALAVLFAVVSLLVMGAHSAVGALSDLLDLRRALALGPLSLVATLVLLAALARGAGRGARAS